MASNSKAASTTALVLCLAIVFFTLASASSCPPKTPAKPAPVTPKPAPVTPKPAPATPKPSSSFKCPKDTLKFGVCGDVLKGLVHVVVGAPLGSPCCDLINDLTAAEAAICLCTAVKANVMGVSLSAPVCVTALFNKCGKKLPKDFNCS